MAAGMHNAGVLALEVYTAVFLNGQSVDICTEHDGFSRLAALNGGDTAGVVLEGQNGDTQVPELTGQIGGSFRLLEGKLCMLMQPVPVACDGSAELGGALCVIHGQRLLSKYK